MSLWINDNYYQQNPSHILGEPYETSGRFGQVIKYRGNRKEALAKIDRPNYEVAQSLNPFVSMETPIINIAKPTRKQKKRILRAVQHATVANDDDSLFSFDDIDREYNKHLTTAEKEAFVYYMRFELKRKMEGGWTKYHQPAIPLQWMKDGVMMYDNGEYLPRPIYLSGNVYEKKSRLERNSEFIINKWGKEVYDAQFRAINEFVKQLYQKRLTLDHPDEKKRLRLLPTSAFVKKIKLKSLKGDVKFKEKLSKKASNYGGAAYFLTAKNEWQKEVLKEVPLKGAFVLWLKNNSRTITFRKGITWLDIAELYLNDKKRGKDDDPDKFKKRKTNAKMEGIRLFGEFLANEISLNDKVRIETMWNMEFNADVPIDYRQIPIGFKMAKVYNGMELDIRPEKREAIAFAMVTGSGCLAYGVGLGKTWAASFIIAQFIENGWCKRPMLVMPNQVYKQFIKEFNGLIPWVKVNGLYNLADEYADLLPGREEKVYGTAYIQQNGEVFKPSMKEIPESQYNKYLRSGERLENYDGPFKGNDNIYIREDKGVRALLTHIKKYRDPVPENSLTAFTFEGFRRLGIRPESEGEFFNTLSRILWMRTDNLNDKREAKRIEKFNEKLMGMIGKSQTGATLYLQDLGIDFMAIDEAHACKKVFTNVVGQAHERLDNTVKKTSKPYKLSAGDPSYMGLKGFMFSQFIQQNNPTGNILLLTATPFTNSPLEVYSMLAMVGFKYLQKNRLDNIIDFFDNFIEVKNALVINVSLNPAYKEIFVGFANLPGLQGMIRRFFLYKTTLKNLKRPNKIVLPIRQKMVNGELTMLNQDERVDTIIPLSPVQRVYMNDVIAYSEGELELVANKGGNWVCANNIVSTEDDVEMPETKMSEEDKKAADDVGEVTEKDLSSDEKEGVRLLRAANYARSLALSPYLYACNDLGDPDYKSYVETSSKFMFTMRCIKAVKEWHENRNEPVSGQVIYMNRGVNYFPLLKEYLVKEIGYKDHEVVIITGDSKITPDKTAEQDKFLGRRFNKSSKEYEPVPDQFRAKVLIGSNSIKEGINLQTHSTVLYNLFLDWNPTDVVQLEGRIWRQGNRFKNVRIVNPLMEDSMDIFMFQKLEEKTARINAIWDFGSNAATLNLEDFDPKELKYALIKDPKRVAMLEVKERQESIDDDLAIVKTQIEMLEVFEKAKSEVFKESKVKDYVKFAQIYHPSTPDGIKDDPNRLQRLISRILREQILWDGRPAMDLESATQFYYVGENRNPYKKERILKGVIQEPWDFQNWKTNLRKYNKSVEDVLKPRYIPATEEGLKLAKEKLEKQIEAFEKEKKKISSEDAIANRAEEIRQERIKSGYQPASVSERVAQFNKLNYLLAERRVEIETGSGTTKNPVYKEGDKVKFDKKMSTILQVFADRSVEVMYRIRTSTHEELVFENELTPTNAKQRNDLKTKQGQSPLIKLQLLQSKIMELRKKLAA